MNIEALQQTGKMAANVHAIEYSDKMTENQIKSEYVKCPWQDAYIALDSPEDWRLCTSGHSAFTESMYKGLNPGATFKLTKSMPSGGPICEGVTKI